MNISEEADLRITWFIAIVLGILVLYRGMQDLVEGLPPSEWIPMVVIGTTILLTYGILKISYWLEGDESSSDRFGLSDWTAVLLTGSWVVMGALFYVSELSSIEGVLFAFFGAIGFAGMLYKYYRVRK